MSQVLSLLSAYRIVFFLGDDSRTSSRTLGVKVRLNEEQREAGLPDALDFCSILGGK